jgi:5-methylthioribose kinase
MRKGLIQGIEYPHFADHIGTFLARTLGGTSDLLLDYLTKKVEAARFLNPEMCRITEDLIFTEPFRPSERNYYHAEIDPHVQAIYADDALRVEAALFKEKFMTHAQALIHGDLHTGSIMVNQTDTYVIDPEFAFYGPMGFDIGAVVGNLLLSYASHEVRTPDPAKRAAFRRYLTETILRLWAVFEREFQSFVWDKVDPVSFPKAYQQGYMLRLLQDTAGFGACKMLRRIIGFAGVADIRAIEDVTEKSIAASLALNMGTALLKRHREIQTIDDLVAIATEQRPNYPYQG